MKLIVGVPNVSRAQLQVKYLIQAAATGLKYGVSEAAFIVETAAKENAPVLTGALRDEIHTDTIEDTPTRQVKGVASRMPYSRRIEYGFFGADSLGRVYHQPAQPYMRPARDQNEKEVKDTIVSSVREALVEASNQVAARR